MNRMIERFTICDRLASSTRYSRDFMVKKESVLEHIGFAALYSYLICRELQSEGHPVNLGWVLTKAVVHDIDESIFGDVPRVTKYFSPETAAVFAKIEAQGVDQLFKAMAIPGAAEDWQGAKDDTIEGQLVAMVDLAAVVYKTWNEIALLGNLSFLRVYRELQGFVAERMTKLAANGNSPLLKYYTEMNQLMQHMKKYDTLSHHVSTETLP